jgi:hypothetical protein
VASNNGSRVGELRGGWPRGCWFREDCKTQARAASLILYLWPFNLCQGFLLKSLWGTPFTEAPQQIMHPHIKHNLIISGRLPIRSSGKWDLFFGFRGVPCEMPGPITEHASGVQRA